MRRPHRGWQAVPHRLVAIDKSSHPITVRNEERAVVVFSEAYEPVVFVWQRIKPRRAGTPLPEPGLRTHPEIAVTVFKQAECAFARAALLTVALDRCFSNLAERPL